MQKIESGGSHFLLMIIRKNMKQNCIFMCSSFWPAVKRMPKFRQPSILAKTLYIYIYIYMHTYIDESSSISGGAQRNLAIFLLQSITFRRVSLLGSRYPYQCAFEQFFVCAFCPRRFLKQRTGFNSIYDMSFMLLITREKYSH